MMWLRALGAVLLASGIFAAFVGGVVIADTIGRPVR